MQYTTKSKVENYLMIDINASFNATIDAYITAMSTYIDEFCNRTIYRTAETTYKYDGDLTNILLISDVVDITAVTVDGLDITSSVKKYPANKGYTSRIVLEDSYFSKGMQNVSVTGIHAMSKTLPSDIEFACTVLVAGAFNSGKASNGSTERIGNYSITYTTEQQKLDFELAKEILNRYKRIAL